MRNSRWAEPGEIKRELTRSEKRGGPVLLYDDKVTYSYPNEGHAMYLGISGAGKSRRGTIPLTRSLIDNRESFVVVDPKGEIAANTLKFLDDGYDKVIFDFRNINHCIGFNPLAHAAMLRRSGDRDKIQESNEEVQDFIDNILSMRPAGSTSDPYWDDSAKNLIIGIISLMMELFPPEMVTTENLTAMLSCGTAQRLQKFLSALSRHYAPEGSTAWITLNPFIVAPSEKTAPSIMSVAFSQLECLNRSPGLSSFLSRNEFHVEDLDADKPTAVYIIVPDETANYDNIAGLIVTTISKYYLKQAHQKYGGTLPRRVNFILEELGNIGKSIPNLPHLMSAGRSRNIRIQFVLQSIGQLDTLYGPSQAETIKSNADVVIAYRINDLATLRELSEKCGNRTVTGRSGIRNTSPLIGAADLASLATGQALVILSGRYRYITSLRDYSEMFGTKPEDIADVTDYLTYSADVPRPGLNEALTYVLRENARAFEKSLRIKMPPAYFTGPTSSFDLDLDKYELRHVLTVLSVYLLYGERVSNLNDDDIDLPKIISGARGGTMTFRHLQDHERWIQKMIREMSNSRKGRNVR